MSGEMTGYFTIHPTTGEIHTDRGLDHDVDPDVILSIQAAAGNPPTYAQAQVRIIHSIIQTPSRGIWSGENKATNI